MSAANSSLDGGSGVKWGVGGVLGIFIVSGIFLFGARARFDNCIHTQRAIHFVQLLIQYAQEDDVLIYGWPCSEDPRLYLQTILCELRASLERTCQDAGCFEQLHGISEVEKVICGPGGFFDKVLDARYTDVFLLKKNPFVPICKTIVAIIKELDFVKIGANLSFDFFCELVVVLKKLVGVFVAQWEEKSSQGN